MCRFSHDIAAARNLEETSMQLEQEGRLKRTIACLQAEVAARRDAHDDEHYARKLGCIVHKNDVGHLMEGIEGL